MNSSKRLELITMLKKAAYDIRHEAESLPDDEFEKSAGEQIEFTVNLDLLKEAACSKT